MPVSVVSPVFVTTICHSNAPGAAIDDNSPNAPDEPFNRTVLAIEMDGARHVKLKSAVRLFSSVPPAAPLSEPEPYEMGSVSPTGKPAAKVTFGLRTPLVR